MSYKINHNNPEKLEKGQCNSLNYVRGNYVQCTEQGIRRYDAGLDCGIHCDEHWEKLLADAREKSW